MEIDSRFLSMIFDNIRENIVVVDSENYEILHANQSFVETYGISLEEIRKKRCYEVTHRNEKPCHESGEECPVRQAADTGSVARCSHVHMDVYGGSKVSRLTAYPIRESDGKIRRVVEISEDISEQARLEEELRKSESALSTAQRIANMGSWTEHIPSRRVEWSDQMYQLCGIDKGTDTGDLTDAIFRVIHPDDRAAIERSKISVIKDKKSSTQEFRIVRPDGEVRTLWSEIGELVLDKDGNLEMLSGIVKDITGQKRAEKELNETLERKVEIEQIARLGYFRQNIVTGAWTSSNMFDDICGIGDDIRRDIPNWSLVHPEDRQSVKDYFFNDVLGKKQAFDYDYRIVRPLDQCVRWIHGFGKVEHDSLGKPVVLIGTAQDITERKQAEETLRQSERKLSLHLQQTMFAVIEWDAEFRVTEWNPAATAIFGYSREEAMGRHVSELILPRSITEDIGKVMSHLLAQSGGTHNTNENVTKDGRVIVCEWINTPLIDERGTAIGGISFALDITERKRAEEELRRSEDRFATVFRASPICTSLSRLSDGTFLDINEAFLRLFGYDRDQVIGSNPLMLNMWVHPDDRARMVETLRERGKANGFETTFRTKSGEIRNVIVISEVVDEAGDQYILGLTLDITDHKNAAAEKEKLQAQLLQAMKMEAVGRLAGGVAHDFNNLLTVITGYCEILLQKVGEESPMYHEMTEIQRAGERAASLTQQLLAFSRKQIIEPKVVHLDHLVAEMHKMLTRLIGEDIALQATTGKSLGSVKVDPGQFQQILMNLAVNARDAMPGGGKIVIETANVDLDEGYCVLHPYVKPGRYMMLAVSDTGMGMSEEVKAHIFEPFFTTKENGKGTGLGLATTYGVVKRAGGSIEVYSEVGIGTTFKIYLPRVEEEAVKPLKSVLSRDLPGGTETVLLVEDEDSVRDLCVQILVRLGYKVLSGVERHRGDRGGAGIRR